VSENAEPICRFYRLIPDAPAPRRADRSAEGMMSVRAYRYCEALASASAFGFYVYPPIGFGLMFDGDGIIWSYDGADEWYALGGAQFPGFAEFFEARAPDGVKRLSPPFLIPAREPGVVQIWSGYLARTAPGWALLSRGLANVPNTQRYENFEGIVATDGWFGPLFTNIRIKVTNAPVTFHPRYPMFQVQPILRQCYSAPSYEVLDFDDLEADEWQRFAATMMPNTDQHRTLGHYAAATRRKFRREHAAL
jgi:hypothetical protein